MKWGTITAIQWQDVTAIMATFVALAGPLVAYLKFARKASGRIATTEAADLWEEAGKLRQEYRDQVLRLQDALDACEIRISELKLDNARLHQENLELKKSLEELRRNG